MSQDLEAVRHVLAEEPDSATSPFWDHDVEPPLCAAVRLRCCDAIVSLLLAHGADVNSEDVHGRTPWMIVRASRLRDAQQALAPDFDRFAVERVLLNAGASSTSSELPSFRVGNVEALDEHWYLAPMLSFDAGSHL